MNVTNVPAPPCPAWCTGTHPIGGWEIDGPDVIKTCLRLIPTDADDSEIIYRLEQFASVVAGRVVVDDPVIRWQSDADVISVDTARLIADVFTRIGDLVSEAAAAA